MSNSVGLDLGSQTIKIVELAKESNNKFRLVTAGMAVSPCRGLITESEVDIEKIAEVLKKLVSDTKISTKKVRVGLPESQVFTFVIETPPLSEKELSVSIKWEAEKYIPIPLDDVFLDWKIVVQEKAEGEKNQVLLVAAPKRIIAKYQKLLNMVGFSALSVETELMAVSRALLGSMPSVKSLMIVNMGAETVDFSILNNGIILFTRSVNTGGMVFTRAIKQELALDDIQAEEYKKTYGFQLNQLDGKTYETLQPFIGSIVTEMKKGIAFYEEKNPNSKLETVLLSGGSALLPGLLEHLAKELNIEVQIGNPWATISLDNKITSQISQINTTILTVATGLALRSDK